MTVTKVPQSLWVIIIIAIIVIILSKSQSVTGLNFFIVSIKAGGVITSALVACYGAPPFFVLLRSLIISTGAEAVWLGAEGEEEVKGKGVSTCATCDGAFFVGKEVPQGEARERLYPIDHTCIRLIIPRYSLITPQS